uniref:Knottin scorpion toxin-like domain-containing protein n=1 Tax=Leersia perrieri TaxID=77586 RepID=A0A0D9VLQ8_9ORYZ
MKNSQQVAVLLAFVLLVSMSPPGFAAKCLPEETCTSFIYTGACEASNCYMDCVAAYKGVGEGQCFPQGCRCSYCCKP